ncbi:MAG TPA: HAMP domain-containing sensor histidine kinase [Sphingomonas sp.]|uniref:sensor histidine kinase n=1 Tax=Sphingomonas sp. TaxID=28214 RepID=UPI002CF31480|nr:HAMP domain-containing sensor histidine kinase [Sphingomonas sp.]HMI18292.1 HAMP domain-containing sensor histidine kinase [Sphingomonas sp.]
MIARLKTIAKRHWPRLGLRTILLSTFILVATLPGFGALFLRVYENTLVRQTESELIAESAALSAATAAAWPGFAIDRNRLYQPEPPTIDLRGSPILPERPAPAAALGTVDTAARIAAARIAPVIAQTTRTTLASVLLLDARGRIALGPLTGRSYATLPEVAAALNGTPDTVLRRNAAYNRTLPVEWLSRSADLRLHHARPIVVNGRTVGVLLLSRSPPALYMGLYADAGKIAFGFAIILGFVVVLSGLLSRGIVRPIERLGLATRDVARGAVVAMPEMPETAAIEIQALYADFTAMAAAIERRSRYLRDFAHAVSHEFKTPLAGIRGAVELLQDHHATMSEAERRRFLGNAAVDAERLALLVTRLLELARADMTPAGAEASDLTMLLRRLADAYSVPGFAVLLELPPDLPPVAVPAGTIETVIGGLIDNSRRAGAARCTIAATLLADSIRLDMADDGPGIAPADRERLFEPFFTTRRADGGTGLGLPIARSLLDACNGTIRLEDDDKGAHFALDLPLA